MDEHDNGDPMNYEEGEETHENDNYMDDKDVVEVVEVNDAGGAPMSEDESIFDKISRTRLIFLNRRSRLFGYRDSGCSSY
jgi:hypothetical protein